MGLFLLGTQEQVQSSRGKWATSVRATEVLLYYFFCTDKSDAQTTTAVP